MNFRLRLPCMAEGDYVFVYADMYAQSKTLTTMVEDMAGEGLAEFTLELPLGHAAVTRQSLELFCIDLSIVSPGLRGAVGLALLLDYLDDSRLPPTVAYIARLLTPLLAQPEGHTAGDVIRAAFDAPNDTKAKERKLVDMYTRLLTGERL